MVHVPNNGILSNCLLAYFDATYQDYNTQFLKWVVYNALWQYTKLFLLVPERVKSGSDALRTIQSFVFQK